MNKLITKLLIFTAIGCIGLVVACSVSNSEPYTLEVKNDLVSEELDKMDIECEAIAPLYLPAFLDRKDINLIYQKSGLSASIKDGEDILADFRFSNNAIDNADLDYPLTIGDAYVSENNGQVILNYRMSDLWVCMITSGKISTPELEKVINSLTVRTVP
jgi:hypothetical protein